MQVAPVSADLLVKIAIGGAVVLAVVYAAKRVGNLGAGLFDGASGALGGAWQYGADAAHSALDAADAGFTNAIVGAGGVVGIPATNLDQCELDLARGDTWAASFSCPASRFIKGVTSPPANVGVTGTW